MNSLLRDRIALGLAAALLLLVLAEAVAIPHYHPVFPWHFVPGYAAVIGLAGCIVVVQISKWLGRTLLQRPETHE
jgi:predicted lysophospholipase L1 biosynthesis ABC-type transport system permease subunit